MGNTNLKRFFMHIVKIAVINTLMLIFCINSFADELFPEVRVPDYKEPDFDYAIQEIVDLDVSPVRDEFYRYELAEFVINNPYTIDYHKIYLQIYRNGEPASGIYGENIVPFRLGKGQVKAYWSPGWDPPVGEYTAVVFCEYPGIVIKNSEVKFSFIKRELADFPRGIAFANLEENSIGRRYDNVAKPPGSAADTGANIMLDWIKFMNFDGLLMMIGQTHGWSTSITPEVPFEPSLINYMDYFGSVFRSAGKKFGAYIMCYHAPFQQGRKSGIEKAGYLPTISFDEDTNEIGYNYKYISINSEKRRRDIVELARRINENPNVDYVGLDFIRTADFDAFGLCDDFISEMSIDIPDDYYSWNYEKRAMWVGYQIKKYKPAWIVDKWRWWRAHRIGQIVNSIINEAEITKPLWTFTLGWEHGAQHGQDPIMMMDAGVSFDAAMLYEAGYSQFNALIRAWKNYIWPGDINLITGNAVDLRLNKSPRDNSVEEHYRRNREGILNIIGGGTRANGYFWHDFMRVLKSSRGGGSGATYRAIEWAMAAAAAVSDYRSQAGIIPAAISIEMDDEDSKRAVVTITNRSSSRALSGKLLMVFNNAELSSSPSSLDITVEPDQAASYEFELTIISNKSSQKDGMMVGVKWELESYKDLFAFIYPHF